jgi:hypothetical protein
MRPARGLPIVRRHVLRPAAVAIALAAAAATPAAAQEQSARDFTWEGRVVTGQLLQIRNINGSITVERASTDRVEVVATKRWRRGDPSIVRVEATRFGTGDGNALVCAIWGTTTTCDEDGYHGRSRTNDNDTRVDFAVKLPAGVRARIESVNGEISIIGATAEVEAETVNGAIEIQTAHGPVQATSVNGGIDVRMDALTGTDDLEFETVNGSITVHLPSDFQGELDMETVNGSLHTDFPMTIQGRFNPRHIRSTVGTAVRSVRLSTVNGGIEVRRAR